MASLLISSLLWSLGGLVFGYILCWFVTSSTLRSMEENMPDTKASTTSNTLRDRHFDVLRAVMGISILLLLIFSSIKYYQVTACQSEYNTQVADSLKERSNAQAVQIQAQIDLLQTFKNAEVPTPKPLKDAALQRYIDALRQLENARSANPITASPNCGG